MKKKIHIIITAGLMAVLLGLGMINAGAISLDHSIDVVLPTYLVTVDSAQRTTHYGRGGGHNSIGSTDNMIFQLRQKKTIGSQLLDSALISPNNSYWTTIWGREDVQVTLFVRLEAENPPAIGYTGCAGDGTLQYD